MRTWAILVAAGTGSRLGETTPKAFVPLAGVPMVAHSLVVLAKVPALESIVLVVGAGHIEDGRAAAAAAIPGARIEVVPGGPTRQDSVYLGLDAIPEDVDRVMVHDAARPLVGVALVESVLAALSGAPAAAAAVPERDTLKRADGDRVIETISREGLWRAQTPQAFRASVLRLAHARAATAGVAATDDATLVERLGETVVLVPGDERNVKVTTPDDLALAETLLAAQHGWS